MEFIRIGLILSLLVFFQACGPTQEDLNREKRAEVIAIHDEVMPKLGQLKAFEKRANQKVDELASLDSVDSDQIERLRSLTRELDQAYEGMFVWMRQYEPEDKEASPEEIAAYLEGQMTLVTEVNRSIKDVLSKSDSLLAD